MTNLAPKTKPVSLLLVDDDDVDVMVVNRALKILKIMNPVIRAKDGIEALEILRNPGGIDRPYIILLDLNMPRMNGLEFLAEIRKDENLSVSIVFVLTTSEDDEDKLKAYKQHIAGYILKNQVGEGFMRVLKMLDFYWCVVELPINELK